MSVVHEHVARLCCTFSRKVLITIFNLGYTRYLAKDLLCNQSAISDLSEEVKQNKTMKLSALKSATCESYLQSRMLRCIVTFLLFIYKQTNSYLTASKCF